MWSKEPVIPPEELPPQQRHSRFSLNVTGMRIHELAVQHWLNKRFLLAEGFPMPVIFTKPMSAYADFKQIWAMTDNNPFAYLLLAKNPDGSPMYQPHPMPPPYPMLTVNRVRWSFAPSRNLGSHWNRHAGWATVAKDVKRKDLGTAKEQRMPQAWDYRLQLDHYCRRADQQAHFIQELTLGWYPSASIPNTWIKAVYPSYIGHHLVRVVQDGDITDATEEEPVEGYRVFRTTVNLLVEGWHMDPDQLYVNTFWTEVDRLKAVSPGALSEVYTVYKTDLRGTDDNSIVNAAHHMPPK